MTTPALGGAGEVVHVEGGLEDDHVEPGLAQQVRQHRAHRPVAHDGDVVHGTLAHHVTVVMRPLRRTDAACDRS